MSRLISEPTPFVRAMFAAVVLSVVVGAQDPPAASGAAAPAFSVQVVALPSARTSDEAVRWTLDRAAALEAEGGRFFLPDLSLWASAGVGADARAALERAVRSGRAVVALGGGGGFGGAVDPEAHARALLAGDRVLRTAGLPATTLARASAAILADPMASLRFRSAGVRLVLTTDDEFGPKSGVRSTARWSRRTGPDGNFVVVHRAFTAAEADFDPRSLLVALEASALGGGPGRLVVCPPRGADMQAASRLAARIKEWAGRPGIPTIAVEPTATWLAVSDADARRLPEYGADSLAVPNGDTAAASRPCRGGASLAAALKAAELLSVTGSLLVEAPRRLDLAAAWVAVAGDSDPVALGAAERAAADAADFGMRALAACTVWRLGAQYVDAVAAPPGAFLVANPTAAVVTEGVLVPLTAGEAALDLDIRDGGGKIVPSQRVALRDGPAIAFVAFKLPPLGVKSYHLARKATDAPPAAPDPARVRARSRSADVDPLLENDALRAVVDRRTGDLRSLTSKQNGAEVLGPGGFRVLAARGGPTGASIGGRGTEASEIREVRIVEDGPVRTVVRVFAVGPVVGRVGRDGGSRGAPPPPIEVDYVLWRASPRLDVVVRGGRLPAELFAAELAAKPLVVSADVAGGIFAPRVSPLSTVGRRFALDLADGRYGLVVSAADGATFLLEGAILRAVGAPTEAPVAGAGDEIRRYSLRPRAALDGASAEGPSELRRLWVSPPVLRVRPDERGGDLHPVLHDRAAELGRGVLASLEDDDAEISSIKRAEDGEGFIVRIVSMRPERGRRDVLLSFPFDVVRAESTDLREGPGTALPTADRRLVTTSIAGVDFATVRIVPAP